MKKKNGFISAVKFLFCLIIIFMHISIPSDFSPSDFSKYMFEGGYLYVDFFFILQGFFLIRNWNKEDVFEASEKYLAGRLKRFFPAVLFAAVIMFVLQVVECNGLRDVCKLGLEFLLQISFISQLPTFMSIGLGGILWFLSAGVVVGTIVLMICKSTGKKIIVLLPLIVSVLYNHIYAVQGNLDIWHISVFGACVNASLERAAAGILLGVIARYVSKKVNELEFRKWFIYFSRVCSLIAVSGTVYMVIYHPHTNADFYEVLVFALILILAENFWSGYSCKLTDYMDKLCMPMFIFQVSCIKIVMTFLEINWGSAVLAVLLDLLLSLVWVFKLQKVKISRIIAKEEG